jgi:MFS family permease
MNLSAQISRTVFLLGIVSLLNDLAAELIMAVLPLFLVALGSGGWVVGLIGGLEDATKSLLSLVFGNIADRVGRKKPLVFLGYLIPSIFRIALAFSTHWAMALVFRVLDRVGKGMRTAPRDALIADAVTEATRGANFGFHRAMGHSGGAAGVEPCVRILLVVALAPDGDHSRWRADLISIAHSVELRLRNRERSSSQEALRWLP